MKRIFVIVCALLFIGCTTAPDGDSLTGHWSYGYMSNITINKAGDKGYFVHVLEYIRYEKYEREYYCTYEDGCFVYKIKGENIPLICRRDNKTLIRKDGNIYKK